MNKKYSYTSEQLVNAVQTSTSLREVITKLNMIPAGGNYKTIQKRILEEGIDTSHFTLKRWTRETRPSSTPKLLSEILKNGTHYQSHKLRIRLLKEGFKEAYCERCLLAVWQGQPIALELEHIDGNYLNNTLENLKILCPNCHAQTSTYRGKNKRACAGTGIQDRLKPGCQ